MIDFILGFVTAAALAAVVFHFTRSSGLVTNGLTATLLEGLRKIMTDTVTAAAASIIQKIEAIPDLVTAQSAAVKAQLDAEVAAHAADLTGIDGAVDAVVGALTPAQ